MGLAIQWKAATKWVQQLATSISNLKLYPHGDAMAEVVKKPMTS